MRSEGGMTDNVLCHQVELVGVSQFFRGTQRAAATANDKCEVLMHVRSRIETEEVNTTHDDKGRQPPPKPLDLLPSGQRAFKIQ